MYNYLQEKTVAGPEPESDSHGPKVGWCCAAWLTVAKDEQPCMKDMLQMYRATRRQKKEDGNLAMWELF